MPVVSIIIPAYNAENYLAFCLNSIVSQITPDVEVIVVDDGSSDRTGEIAKGFAGGMPLFQIVRQKNGGVSAARKTGLSHTTGEYVWFVDSDDYLLDGALGTVLSCIQDHPGIDTVFAPVLMHEQQNGQEWIKPFAAPDALVLRGKDYLMKRPVSVCPVQFVFRRRLFDNEWVYFPEGLRHEDEYFCRTLQYYSDSMLLLDKPLYVYRQWDGSFMNSKSVSSLYDMVEIYKHLSLFVEQGAEKKDREWLRPDIFSFLMGTHFWHIDIINTPAFRAFRKKNLPFLKKAFAYNARYFTFKERILDLFMLLAPGLCGSLISLHSR